jgi:hypothetical protein
VEVKRHRAATGEDRGQRAQFDIEESTGVVEVKLWLDSGNYVFMAGCRAACQVKSS